MKKIMSRLFSDYLSNQNIALNPQYSALAKKALEKEKELRCLLNKTQTENFEQLLEITSQIHFLEVKDAFFSGCKIGIEASKEFTI